MKIVVTLFLMLLPSIAVYKIDTKRTNKKSNPPVEEKTTVYSTTNHTTHENRKGI